MMIRTFIDSGVLIDAARGEGPQSKTAMDVLADPDRVLLTSLFVRLEVYPKVEFNSFPLQRAFLTEFFMDSGLEWRRDLNSIV